MVGHEAAEVIGSIGQKAGLESLNKFKNHAAAPIELQQTRQIPSGKIKWLYARNTAETFQTNAYKSFGPTAPLLEMSRRN